MYIRFIDDKYIFGVNIYIYDITGIILHVY